MATYDAALFWYRRDLRDADNAGLSHALKCARRVYCAFVYDREILDALGSRRDRRVQFIHGSVRELRASLRAKGGELLLLHGRARDEIPALAARLGAGAVFTNGDYEPQARARDDAVEAALEGDGRRLHRAKDQALFEKGEIVSSTGRPFSVFTPYRNAWMARLDAHEVRPHEVEAHAGALARPPFENAEPTLGRLGFEPTDLEALGVRAGMSGAAAALEAFAPRLDAYHEAREHPAADGTSRLSVHNRFGTVSIRALARIARGRGGEGARTWLSELAWRDFFFQVLWHHPRVATSAFRAEYDALAWPGEDAHFDAWREARTGYPLVDAAMAQLRDTGFMHNRLRMVTASFLAKDLLVDWRRGERHFAGHLLDFDLAANNGGWQWAASTGCDAQPYFRIFNPVTQSEKFDSAGTFIRRFVPALARVPDSHIHAPWKMGPLEQQAAGCVIGRDYPAPVVDHAAQRVKALALYRRGREASPGIA